MFYLAKESFKRRQIDDLLKRTAATSPKSMASAVLWDEVVTVIRRTLRKRTGHQIEEKEIKRLLPTWNARSITTGNPP